jgi:hypothetical protein
MTLQDFENTLRQSTPPAELSPLLKALWSDARGDWEQAHHLAQDVNTMGGSWIHAYLHRKEGDRSNALYWYHRAGKKMPTYSLEQEWKELVIAFLRDPSLSEDNPLC